MEHITEDFTVLVLNQKSPLPPIPQDGAVLEVAEDGSLIFLVRMTKPTTKEVSSLRKADLRFKLKKAANTSAPTIVLLKAPGFGTVETTFNAALYEREPGKSRQDAILRLGSEVIANTALHLTLTVILVDEKNVIHGLRWITWSPAFSRAWALDAIAQATEAATFDVAAYNERLTTLPSVDFLWQTSPLTCKAGD